MQQTHAMVKAEYRRAVTRWLLSCALMVALMVLAGGYTRLTGSGLSITEWKPLHGAIPPLSDAAWQEEFAAYKATPQYAMVNAGMTLAEFKSIFWPEFLHRLLGRAAGLVFFAPLAWFVWKQAFSRHFTLRMAGIFALGGAQGAMGWYMVKSGLLAGPYVSHFRLAAHLSLAFLIFALLLWTALSVQPPPEEKPLPRGYKIRLHVIFSLLCVQIFYGALVAGLHAGLIYNTFPTMNGEWLPEDLTAVKPLWENLFNNIAGVQFIHRWLALGVAGSLLLWWLEGRNYAMSEPLGRLRNALAITVLAQVALGITTLLMQVPVALGVLHQFTALLLFALVLATMNRIRHATRAATLNPLPAAV